MTSTGSLSATSGSSGIHSLGCVAHLETIECQGDPWVEYELNQASMVGALKCRLLRCLWQQQSKGKWIGRIPAQAAAA